MTDALKLAAEDGDLEEVKRLIEQDNVPVDQSDDWGDSALHGAVAKGRLQVVLYLLEKGADPNARNKAGSTPLHKGALAKYDQLAILRILLEKNADPLIKNASNMLPEQLAPGDLAKKILAGKDFFEDSIDVPRAKHGRIIGKGGMKMRQVQSESGAHVIIPKAEAQSDRIILKGRKEAVAKAKQLIQELVKDEDGDGEGKMTTKFYVPKDKHKLIIGKSGSTINEIREQANVDIIIPPQHSKDEHIVIKGSSPDGIESAIKRIQEVTGGGPRHERNEREGRENIGVLGSYMRRGSGNNFNGGRSTPEGGRKGTPEGARKGGVKS